MEDIKLLLVEDDEAINNMIKKSLIKEGYKVSNVFDGQGALDAWKNEEFKLIILDIMLPNIDGIEVMRRIRLKSMVPILMVSAKAEECDKVIGLGLGADDYLVKPFSIAELMARVKAQLRRYMYYNPNEDTTKNIIEYGEIKLDLNNYSIIKKGKTINLRLKEYEIIKLFFENTNKVFTKAQIFNSVWGEEYMGDDNTVMVHIRRVRSKIEDNPDEPKIIETVWGIGYRLGNYK